MKNLDHPRKDCVKYFIDIIKQMLEKWGPKCLTVNYSIIHQLISNDNLNGIRIIGSLLLNEMSPWDHNAMTSQTDYFDNIVSKINIQYKKVYQPMSEVMGLVLKFYSKTDFYNQLFEMVKSHLRRLPKNDKFYEILYLMHLNHPPMATPFVSSFLYGLKSVGSNESLNYCLSMIASNTQSVLIESDNGLTKELNMMGLNKYLSDHHDPNVIGQCIKIIQHVHKDLPNESLLKYIGLIKVENLTKSSSRNKFYNLMEELYREYQNYGSDNLQKSIYNTAKSYLLRGTSDPNPNLANDRLQWFDKLLNQSTNERFIQIFHQMLSPDSQNNFMNFCTNLILNGCEGSHDFSRKLFENPLSDCIFTEQHINTNWRTQHSTLNTQLPSSVVTSSSQQMMSSSQGSQRKTFLRKTQQTSSLAFMPTQTSMDFVDGSDESSSSLSSSLSNNESITSLKRGVGGRRFHASDGLDHEKTKEFFASKYAKDERRKLKFKEEHKLRKEAQVSLMRTYRIGELPDIQIAYADVIKPLRALCHRDPTSSKSLMVLFYKSLIHEDEDNLTDLTDALKVILNDPNYNNKTAIETVLEIIYSGQIDVFTDIIDHQSFVNICTSLGLEKLGILIIQQNLTNSSSNHRPTKKKRKDDDEENSKSRIFNALAQLYQSLGDGESLRAISRQELSDDTFYKQALTYESLNEWSKASELYKKCNNGDNDPLITQGYYNSLVKLSKWEDISKDLEDKHDCSSSSLWDQGWKEKSLVPLHLSANWHKLIEQPEEKNPLFGFVDKSRKDPRIAAVVNREYSTTLSLMHLFKDNIKDSKYWLEKSLNQAFEKPLDLLELKRISQLNLYFNNREKLNQILNEAPSEDDDVQFWDHLLCDSLLMSSQMSTDFQRLVMNHKIKFGADCFE